MKYVLTVLFIASAFTLYANGSQEDDSMMKDDSAMMEDDSVMMEDDSAMMEDDMMVEEKTETMMMMKDGEGGTVEFTDLTAAQMYAKEGPSVLFFNADWCPTCKQAMMEFKENADNFGDIKVFIVDYDNSAKLQKKYGVSYQHTFVQVDEDGEAITMWNGGEFDELVAKVER